VNDNITFICSANTNKALVQMGKCYSIPLKWLYSEECPNVHEKPAMKEKTLPSLGELI